MSILAKGDGNKGKYSRFEFGRIGLYIHFITMGIILIFLLFLSEQTDYSYKRFFKLGNGMLLCIGLLLAIFLVVCFNRGKTLGEILRKHSDRAISIMTKALFFAQIYFCYSAYFCTGWDVAVINNGATEVSLNLPLSDTAYFSQYPNNLLLTYLFSLIKRVDRYFGIFDVNEGIMCILCIQCLISSLTGYLLFKIVRDLTGYRGAWCAWFCYLVLVAGSGWLLIPYSDSVGLFLPVTILYLYRQLQKGRHIRGKWMAIGALAGLGYHIKPQVFLIFIAIVLVEFTCRLSGKTKEKTLCKGGVLYAIAGLLIISLFYHVFMMDLTRQLDSEKAFGITHFVMMGLNPVNNGGYLYRDVEFSGSYSTRAERAAGNMEVIRKRLQDMGFSGLRTHLAKKLLTNYGDGTFAWEMEGNFFSYIGEQKNAFLSLFLRNLTWGGGNLNALSETVKQGIWLFILTASLGLIGCKSADNTLLIAAWTIVGLTLFELLFEARARYLYIYSPFYIIAGISGAAQIIGFFQRKYDNVKKERTIRST